MPILLDQNPEAVRSRNEAKNDGPCLMLTRRSRGSRISASSSSSLMEAISSSRAVRSPSVASTKAWPKRSTHTPLIQASPPRMAVWRRSRWRSVSVGSFMR